MMWIVIITLVFAVFGKFFWDRKRLERRMREKGGVKVVYDVLIKKLMEIIPNSEVLGEEPTMVFIGIVDGYSLIAIELHQGFRSSIIIKFTIKSKLAKVNSSLKWEFKDFDDHEFIADKVKTELNLYFDNLKDS